MSVCNVFCVSHHGCDCKWHKEEIIGRLGFQSEMLAILMQRYRYVVPGGTLNAGHTLWIQR